MRVLVTRPEPASARTAAELERRGHEPVLLPLMQAVQQPQALAPPPLTGTAAIAVTSAEAMRVIETLTDEAQQPFLALPLFAVGRATARAARDAGFDDVSVADGDGRSLARLLIARRDPAAPIIYLTGTPRSSEFETDLAEAGYSVDIRECYRMIPATHADAEVIRMLTPMPDAILVYSSETARRLGELHNQTRETLDWRRVRFLCLSDKIASALPAEIQPNSQWSMEPREDQLLLLL
ncbi:uroporphyrinogen-III synthase [Peteryoungia aggregata LMG 23059]|uniref:Uroporphyrinogen-III synthase n=1 Tax=Peteryoungia aggregata LMG 23059 TaxID=1368425 RepID=A0ABU0G7I5_9HYPH|nr:uroporphyrinogen-III synthase [Peteryoungia aggregata]MDQ0420640.1 uroporphyrinogen-III synthase [Peteryoungia aggregata LMG 23059]